jgi:hypothetical protein
MDCHGQGSFGLQLADDILIEVLDDRAGGWDISKEFFRRPTAALLLFEHRGAQLDALAADVNLSGPFDQGADIPITLATKRTVLFGVAVASRFPAGHYILT